MTKPHCDLPGWWTWKGNFALQTIWNDGGGGNWIPSQFPTMDDALAHIQRYIRKNRRILIWRENSEEEAREKLENRQDWFDADFSHAFANDDDYEYDLTDAQFWKVEEVKP